VGGGLADALFCVHGLGLDLVSTSGSEVWFGMLT